MVHESTLRQVALDYPVKKQVLQNRIEKLKEHFQNELGHHYKEAISNRESESAMESFIIHETNDWILFGIRGHKRSAIKRVLNWGDEEIEPVREYFDTRARSLLPDEKADADVLVVCTPIIVEYPEWWQKGAHLLQAKLQRLVEQGLSPAEALDFLVVNQLKLSSSSWADSRNVSSVEAVRKNVRQAKEKIEHDEESLTENP